MSFDQSFEDWCAAQSKPLSDEERFAEIQEAVEMLYTSAMKKRRKGIRADVWQRVFLPRYRTRSAKWARDVVSPEQLKHLIALVWGE